MKYITIVLLAWMSVLNQAGQEAYVCKSAKISLFSAAAIQDIAAETSTGTSSFNAATGALDFSVRISSFIFPKPLMQEHFNSERMESDKYPRATFKGKINEHIDVNKNGTYPVNVTGELDVHGVKKPRTIPGTITVNDGVISMKSEFIVKSSDHAIDAPKLFFHKVGEVVTIKVSATYSSAKK